MKFSEIKALSGFGLVKEFEQRALIITRDGADELFAWLKTTNFFSAPASTKFHSAFNGGLAQHSIAVHECLLRLLAQNKIGASDETLALVALYHDICKADIYVETTRNVKNPDTGIWEQVPYYEVKDGFPFGHGEKSVILLREYVDLSRDEMLAVNTHMGGFDERARSNSYLISNTFEACPLAVLLHEADLQATFLRYC
jgi:hypothetical protein